MCNWFPQIKVQNDVKRGADNFVLDVTVYLSFIEMILLHHDMRKYINDCEKWLKYIERILTEQKDSSLQYCPDQ